MARKLHALGPVHFLAIGIKLQQFRPKIEHVPHNLSAKVSLLSELLPGLSDQLDLPLGQRFVQVFDLNVAGGHISFYFKSLLLL